MNSAVYKALNGNSVSVALCRDMVSVFDYTIDYLIIEDRLFQQKLLRKNCGNLKARLYTKHHTSYTPGVFVL
jgi:hypothetical protein